MGRDGGAHVGVDVEADREVDDVVLLDQPVDHLVAGPGAVAGNQQPAPMLGGLLGDGFGDHGDQVRGGVTARVPRSQQETGQLAGVVDPAGQRVVTIGALERARSSVLTGV